MYEFSPFILQRLVQHINNSDLQAVNVITLLDLPDLKNTLGLIREMFVNMSKFGVICT